MPEEQPKFSIVIAAHDNGRELETNLPSLLEQRYEAGFEVIVVDESSTDDTEDVLKILQQKYPHLYCTFIPDSSHYVSRRKLALTLGIKAAKNEWIVFTDATCKAPSDQWLATLASHCDEETDIVMGYENYDDTTSSSRRFFRLYQQRYLLRKKTAYHALGKNLAFRKQLFMQHNGFLKNLPYLRGEYDFLVNEYATKGHTALALEPEATIRQDEPTKKLWNNDNIFYQETRRHLRRSIPHRLRFITEQTMLHICWIATLAATVFGAITSRWIVCAIGGGCLVLLYVLRAVFLHRSAKRFDEPLPTMLLPIYELSVVWKKLYFKIRHLTSDKYDFIRR